MFKSGFVAIIGKPNVGKSSLVNALVKEKVSIVSPKAHTTRDKILGVYNTEDRQIVFIDTPGLLKAKTKLDEYMDASSSSAVNAVDAIILVLDGKKRIEESDIEQIKKYASLKIPLIVVVNKTDATTFERLYPELEKLNSLQNVSAIIPLSALRGKNLQPLLDEIDKHLTDQTIYFEREAFTDQSVRFMASETIREKALWLLREEIPTGMAVEITEFSEEDKLTRISANLICEKESHKQIVVGKNGTMIKQIGTNARLDLEKMLNTKVFLELFVKVKPNWKEKTETLNSLGYNKNKI